MCTIMLVSCSFGRKVCVSLHQKGCGSAATPFCVNLPAFLFKSVDIKLISRSVFEPQHEIYNNVLCATNKGSDEPALTRSLIRAFAGRLHTI